MAVARVALLRAVNVGGTGKVPMADLRTGIADAGFGDVATYVQSGNVVFSGAAGSNASVEKKLEEVIAATFGFAVPVVVRTAAEMRKVAAHHPFAGDADGGSHIHVLFMRDMPTKQAIAALDMDRSPPDRIEIRGQEIYAHLVNGARSRYTARWLDKQFNTTVTARNWNTVTKLAEMAAAL